MSLRLEKSVLRKHKSKSKILKKKFNILLVDDEKENLDSLSLVLDRDYNLIFANDGKEAFQLIKNNDNPEDIHVIISDQRMPNMTGVELFKLTRELIPNAVRIILTGFTDADAIISSINDGQIYKFLTKPIDPVDLRLMVKSSLEFYTNESANEQLVSDLQNKVDQVEGQVRVFEKFVPRQIKRVITNSIDEPYSTKIENQKHEDVVTILFADIRSFSSHSLKMQSKQVLEFLNNCFSFLSKSIHKNSGFVDKYIGDSIMALFDLPEATKQERAGQAVQAALDIQNSLCLFNKDRQKQSLEPIEIDIGIHSGPVIIGTVGGDKRMDLTVLGNSVTQAASLEALNRQYSSSIIISSQAKELLGNTNNFNTRSLGLVKINGAVEPMQIYAVEPK